MSWKFWKSEPPKPTHVGYWKIYGLLMLQYRKPSAEHIKNHQELLGWEWVDVEK